MSKSTEYIERYIKSARSLKCFAENNFFTLDYTGNISKVDLTDEQRDILHAFVKSDSIAIKKTRQIGVTSALALYVAHCLLFKCDKTIVYISAGNRFEFLQNVKNILFQSEFFENDSLEKENKKEIKYNSSRLIVQADNINSTRGFGIEVLICDEASYLKSFKNIWMGAVPLVLARSGKAIITSTVGGPSYDDFDELFYQWNKNSKVFHRKLILEKARNKTINYNFKAIDLAY